MSEVKIEPRVVDRTGWSSGPWDNEPDELRFEHEGVPCILLRNRMGAWCGYAAVPPGHPWHGKEWDGTDADVHGGITYAERCQGDVCHIPKPGEPDNVWWLGFDCNHAWDIAPGTEALNRRMGLGWRHFGGEPSVYRPMSYAKAETESLARQILAAGGAK